MKSPASYVAANRRRRAIEIERRESMLYGSMKALIEDAAERWAVENFGAVWPDDSLDEIRQEIGSVAVDGELNTWRVLAGKCAEKVLKARMPPTLGSMEDAFHNRIPKNNRGGAHGRVGRK